MISLPLIAGFRTSATRAVVQIVGTALRIDSEALAGTLLECACLERRLQQFAQIMAMQATQIAAKNVESHTTVKVTEVNSIARPIRALKALVDKVETRSHAYVRCPAAVS